MSLTKTQAELDAQAALDALVAADNALFIAAIDAQILEAIDLGHFYVSSTTWGNVDAKTIFEYYVALGYFVYFPDFPQCQNWSPSNLFGPFWEAFWNHTLFPRTAKNPIRLIIAFKDAPPWPWPWPCC